jgi:hypothetical protein
MSRCLEKDEEGMDGVGKVGLVTREEAQGRLCPLYVFIYTHPVLASVDCDSLLFFPFPLLSNLAHADPSSYVTGATRYYSTY